MGLGERRAELTRDVGLRTHVDDLLQMTAQMDEVVFVAHSYAGLVVREAVDRHPSNVRGIVLIDAWAGPNGSSLATLAPDWFMPVLVATAERDGDGWRIPVPDPSLVGVTDPDDVALLVEMCSPQPLLSFTESTVLSSAIDLVPCEAILCSEGIGIPFADFAVEFGWPTSTIECGHDAMLLQPEQLAALIGSAIERFTL
jgi:pimeloyl-ACP methyl ester carboxylesterase